MDGYAILIYFQIHMFVQMTTGHHTVKMLYGALNFCRICPSCHEA